MEKSTITHDEHAEFLDEITPASAKMPEMIAHVKETGHGTPDMRRKIAQFYGRKAEEDHVAPSGDLLYILDKITFMTEEEAMDILVRAIAFHKSDPNFPGPTMAKIKLLVQGPKAVGLETTDFDFDLKAEAAIIHYHSPYPEVRSVTDAFDDPTIPVETIRSYFLGMVFMVR